MDQPYQLISPKEGTNTFHLTIYRDPLNKSHFKTNIKRNSQLNLKKIKDVACNSEYTYALSTNGELIMINGNNIDSNVIQNVPKNVLVYAVGSSTEHTMLHAIDCNTKKFRLFGIGLNDRIQIINLPIKHYTKWVEISKDDLTMQLVSLSCGKKFTVHLNLDGKVFVFGLSNFGRIGTNHNKILNIDSFYAQDLYGYPIISLAASQNHCIALTATGVIFVCAPQAHFEKNTNQKFDLGTDGNSQQKSQISDNKNPKETPFVKFDQLYGKFIVKISSLGHRCAALDNEGKAYVWNCNNKCNIHEINVDQITIENKEIIDIAFYNESYFACLTSTHSLYVFDLDNNLRNILQIPVVPTISRIFHCCKGMMMTQSNKTQSQTEIIQDFILSKEQNNDRIPKLLYINRNNIDLFLADKNNYNLLKATFSSLSAINGSFIIRNQPETTEDCLIDFDLVIEFYDKLKETNRMDEFNRTFMNTVNDMLIDQMTNLESSKLRFLVVALLHPLETESDIDFWKTIIKYITRSNANETLKQWFKNFDQDIFQRIVNSLLKFFDEPKANKLYTFNQDVARVLSIIYSINEES
ncbi:hypothetical protein TVAG_117170 [Trichomonas vaginalis G3]|uniref:BTB domain-containing protein n=1 Tax=Trichomonas vaginalis (strain ATCC PRA-98 / G3) TaxID=412133 RepID=A2E3Q7_TRIV3|nr:guanyl-nucleotide exchange factor protein [Trichomonas vaginalis G3]EAY12695.1 hypothetical protein TVAG_117170 [Trichomonas vaginalis G3]KAI5517543.1 guanyl-nucleotide exchange factor protein [Trichomonas vaginalis G3]|eukprot:XP_001324918.1 hypothetical protein [Trichomonas vaginalis G3]